MSENWKSVMVFEDYRVTELRFDAGPDCRPKGGHELSVELSSSHRVSDDRKHSQVMLRAVVSTKCSADDPGRFSLTVTMVGFFRIEGEEDPRPDHADALLTKNALAVLFPYLRAAITSVTSTCNIGAVILPLVNVNAVVSAAEKTDGQSSRPEEGL